nr:uncharacterized protein LOC111426064 [Onthophagus taurus]
MNEEQIPLIREVEEQHKWDIFEDPPVNKATGSSVETKYVNFAEKLGKFCTYIVVFLVVLGGAVISKGCLLFMTSQLNIKEMPYCNEKLDRTKNFSVEVPEEERLVWVWMLIFAFFVPQLGTFIRSLRIMLYKSWKIPYLSQFLSVFISETCSTIGNAILVFVVLPKLDVLKGIMLTNAFCFIPAVFSKYTIYRNDLKSADGTQKLALDLLSVVIQISSFFVFPLISDDSEVKLIPLVGIFISIGWWENFTMDYKNLRRGWLRNLVKANKKFSNSRYFTYSIVSIYKCALFLLCAVLIEKNHGNGAAAMFDNFINAFHSHNITVKEITPIDVLKDLYLEDAISPSMSTKILSDVMTPVWVFLIFIGSTYICYVFGKFACKTYIQGFGLAFPINLAVPVTITGLITICGLYISDDCAFSNSIPPYLFFNLPPLYNLGDFLANEFSWIWILWLFSQVWITAHLWTPKAERLAKTERLFVRPMYEPFLIDQDVAMNRRRLDELPREAFTPGEVLDAQILEYLSKSKDPSNIVPILEEDSITRIYGCGTMWHETKEEMITFLKSIIRMDEDQCARRIVKNYLQIEMPDYYEFETHIFFDDAFVRKSQDDTDPKLNRFVKDLIEAVDEATSIVHEVHMKVKPPVKYVTPYGGRLVWTLPGKTKLIAHLKDKKKIRPKKRWSQVMYMYYILGHMIVERDDIDECKKALRAHNTYILALDGDIDFQPKAVTLLVDLMKKDESLGAACGRIHPIGNGIMAWYQMFEYAIGHWLQKATEHVIGCVLCSPGCFTLFRGGALMDVSVMRKYATTSSEALHYVQFDQGEDRWLSTLLLQRGYRVEYSAASDAYTHCPEGFNEFFNQRRRWVPSTTANILDLLINSDRTVKVNNNISKLYIAYQSFLMVGTILGPGTIFVMLIGAFVAAFQMDQWTSFIWNSIPIMIFVITCTFYQKDKTQLFIAGILSGVYCLVMMAVLVGIVLQIKDDGFLAPSSLFFFCVAGQMISVAMLHPKEFNCLKFGLVYYVTVPCMYMILIIYSVFNMNNVSWGTREVTVESSAEQIKKKEKNGAKGAIINFLDNISKKLFAEKELAEKSKLDAVLDKLEMIEKGKEPEPEQNIQESVENETAPKSPLIKNSKHVQLFGSVPEHSWIRDNCLKYSAASRLPENELLFWENLLRKYLEPIDDSKDKARIAEDLKDLRDKVVMSFFMINAIFVLVIFLLTVKKDDIHLNWPFNAKSNFTYNTGENEIIINKKYLELEPVGIVFLAMFFLVLIVQYIAMLIHRFGTFSQIMANTTLDFNIFTKSTVKMSQSDIMKMNPVKFVKKLQSVKDVDDDENEEFIGPSYSQAAAINRLQKAKKGGDRVSNDLEENFRRRTEIRNFSKSSVAKLDTSKISTVSNLNSNIRSKSILKTSRTYANS